MGLHGTALTIGIAGGAPVAGAIIDAFGPAWGFATAGLAGVGLVALALPLWPRRTSYRTTRPTAHPTDHPTDLPAAHQPGAALAQAAHRRLD
jgi:MFS family permease